MRSSLEQMFQKDVPDFTKALEKLDTQLGPDAIPPAAFTRGNPILDELTNAIQTSVLACHDVEAELGLGTPELAKAQARFREVIAPWFNKSWFMHRGLSKPRGYPGDYELLTGIYEARARSTGLGGYLDLYFLDTDLARAVVGRAASVKEFLTAEADRRSGDISVVNVACGPCREFINGLDLPDGCHMQVTCVDYDEAALDHVRTHVQPHTGWGLDLQPVRHNALRMINGEANIRKFGRPDIVYSVGLCDYIPDRMLISMLRGWREMLADGGVVFVAFKDCRRYDKTEYQWHVDWHFYQRTEADCRRLFLEAGYEVEGLSMTRDESEVIMNFAARSLVATPVQVRIDSVPGDVGAPNFSAMHSTEATDAMGS